MGILEISQKKPYKIATWVVLGLGCLFVLLGGLFMLTGVASTPIRPGEIHLATSGIVRDEITGSYKLDISRRETSVMVSTAPLGSGSRVTFDTGTPGNTEPDSGINRILRITDAEDRDLTATNRNGRHINAIWPGESFIITLVGGAETSFQFGEKVSILVKSEAAEVLLEVNIVLPPGQAGFDFVLREAALHLPVEEIRAQDYYDAVYRSFALGGTLAHGSPYEFVPRFMVWGSEIRNVDVTVTPVDFAVGFIELQGIPRNTPGWGPFGFENIYIPQEVIVSVMSSRVPMEFVFMVTTYHFGKHIDFFTLRIV